ncbi:hypothetical protein W97_02236 [Coniosporium apollinis CBS 100218]|uniref:Uncharacterized protein n=1 Tax=Coniosporium apollinis (strain CBS 100218) TaxID=1168221 RepID=R7YM74_CONA1|nr:uncharacterized protein W97_02236 [Coniosporium apollinis CBS 100218]EON63010.1 hypothetical protein W97_02236 [Coniosporium apollinis CBS 100218]
MFYCNGQSIIPWDRALPEGTEEYRVCSMYYDRGTFYAINYDATKYQVGDGDDGDGPACPEHGGHNSPHYMDWFCLGFRDAGEAPDRCRLSSATVPIGQHTLCAHLSREHWPGQLFSEIYHADDQSQKGGLVGELPIILALVAFSIHPQLLQYALISQFCNGVWTLDPDQQHGRFARRGMVVTVWCAPSSSRAALEAYELGGYGCMFH